MFLVHVDFPRSWKPPGGDFEANLRQASRCEQAPNSKVQLPDDRQHIDRQQRAVDFVVNVHPNLPILGNGLLQLIVASFRIAKSINLSFLMSLR